ncbi:putative methyltransferase NSUN7 [Echeneis naucrates]|uniref:putative methyltransferase NSUN7 n=1 Tax=Echeneis naucrates TaxID=173247 RepID=UPI0011133AFC|nr:putative methyltransferase NSUN7 [Echeneis naucrates]
MSCVAPLKGILSDKVCPPSDQAYLQASAIFQQLREEKPVALQILHYAKKADTPLPESRDKTTQKQAYQLAFNTLKYQDLLEDVITDSCFQTSQHLSADMLPLAMVMLFDLQNRRFQSHKHSTKEGEEPLKEVRELESSLHRWKTKLAASLARCRVKQSLLSFSCFLSDHVRIKQRQAKCLPLYTWVNALKASVEEVCEVLQSAGFGEVKDVTDLSDLTFCRDALCPDTLVFPKQCEALLQESSLTAAHVLEMQDRSVCVAVSVLRPLLFDSADVLVVGSFSGLTVAHIAVAAAARSGRVLLCGADHTVLQVEEIQELLKEMDIKNVRILSEAFCGLNEWDATVQHLKVIIVLPQCSSSALNDPVPTIHSEHGDWDLLPHLSHGSVSQRKIHAMTNQQAQLLAHSLTFPKVQTVVYCTRSVYPEENEQLVNRVLEKTRAHPKLLPFRVNGPIFPVESQSEDATDPKFFKLEPSQFTNGFFIARLSRQADPTKVETVQDVLARAAAKGLLGEIFSEQSKPGKRGKSKKSCAVSADSKPPSPSGQQTKELENGQDPVASPGNQEERGSEIFKGSKDKDENQKGEEEKKRRVLKGRKRKLKIRHKQTDRSPSLSKTHKKKSLKRKMNTDHNKHLRKNKRRIPRLTLTLMSSAKPSIHLSPITALAHKLSDNATVKSQQSVFSSSSSAGKHPSPLCPASLPPPAAPKEVQRKDSQPRGAGKTLKDLAKPVSPFNPTRKVVRPEEVLRAAYAVLPPISSLSSCSLHSRSSSSLHHTSQSQHPEMSASSS